MAQIIIKDQREEDRQNIANMVSIFNLETSEQATEKKIYDLSYDYYHCGETEKGSEGYFYGTEKEVTAAIEKAAMKVANRWLNTGYDVTVYLFTRYAVIMQETVYTKKDATHYFKETIHSDEKEQIKL